MEDVIIRLNKNELHYLQELLMNERINEKTLSTIKMRQLEKDRYAWAGYNYLENKVYNKVFGVEGAYEIASEQPPTPKQEDFRK